MFNVHASNVVDKNSPRVPLLVDQGRGEGPLVGVVAHQALHSMVMPFQAVVGAAA